MNPISDRDREMDLRRISAPGTRRSLVSPPATKLLPRAPACVTPEVARGVPREFEPHFPLTPPALPPQFPCS